MISLMTFVKWNMSIFIHIRINIISLLFYILSRKQAGFGKQESVLNKVTTGRKPQCWTMNKL